MCRFTLYLGPSIRLSKLLIEPEHSLIHQSVRSKERREPLNGDGFGVGWYAPRLSREPAVFHSVTPAWNDRNLRELAPVVASPCVLAHVRAATPGFGVDLANCHPFAWRRQLLMHNGYLNEFTRLRRRLLAPLCDEAFNLVRGSTDTEHLFAVFVDQLLRHEKADERARDPALRLAEHLAATLQHALAASHAAGVQAPHYLNLAVSNGQQAVVSRFTTDPTSEGDSLYVLQGQLYETTAQEFGQRAAEEREPASIVSSERLTTARAWTAVPRNHLVVLERGVAPRLLALGPGAELAL